MKNAEPGYTVLFKDRSTEQFATTKDINTFIYGDRERKIKPDKRAYIVIFNGTKKPILKKRFIG